MDYNKQILSTLVTVINSDGEILLCKKEHGGWNIPTSVVAENESLRTAAIKSTKDQTGISIKLLRFCGIFQNMKAGVCHASFFAKQIGGDIKSFDIENSADNKDKILDVGFFPLGTAFRVISWKLYKQRILYSIDDTSQPFFIEF